MIVLYKARELKRIFVSLGGIWLKHKYWTDFDLASNGLKDFRDHKSYHYSSKVDINCTQQKMRV